MVKVTKISDKSVSFKPPTEADEEVKDEVASEKEIKVQIDIAS